MSKKYPKIKAKAKPLSRDARLVRIKTEHNNTGLIKTLVFGLSVLLQLGILLYLYFRYVAFLQWYMILTLCISIATCLYVLSTDKTGQSKAVWIMFLLLGSSVGFIFYILSDERIFFAKHKKRYDRAFRDTRLFNKGDDIPPTASEEVKTDIAYLASAGDFPAYTGNAVRYFPSGASCFDDILLSLRSAEKFIFIEFFIIADGVLLNRTLDILGERVKKGVDVRIIYDDVGSRMLTRKAKKRIKAAGVKLEAFNRLIPRFNVMLNYRDHRKIVVVDGKRAYTGGINLADEYVNEKRMYGYWKDIGVRVDGPAVDGISLIFLRQWQAITGKSEEFAPFLNNAARVESAALTVPYADGLDYPQAIAKNVYVNLMAGAKEKLYIMTPYFVADETISAMLALKARSGVDVRLVIPEVADKPYVYRVTRNNAEKLLESGVKLYCMRHSFVHAKAMLTENAAVVGSANMDMRSFYQQFECGIYSNDEALRQDLHADFEQVFADSQLITGENVQRKNIFLRILSGLLQFFSPLM